MSDEFLVSLSNSDKETVSFKTKEHLKTWVTSELEIWQNFRKKIWSYIESISDTHLRSHWHHIINGFDQKQLQIISEFSIQMDRGLEQEFPIHLQHFKQSSYVFSSSSKAQKTLQLADVSAPTALLLFSIWHPKIDADHFIYNRINQFNGSQFKAIFFPLSDAYIEAHLFEKGFKGTAKVEKEALKAVKNDLNALMADINKELENYEDVLDQYKQQHADSVIEFEKVIKNKQNLGKAIIRKQNKALEDLKKLYKEELSLQIPVTYWKDKAKSHQLAAYIWGGSFSVIIVLLVSFSPVLLEKMVESAHTAIPSISNNPLSLLFVVSFPAFLLVWLLRMLARNIITNFSQMHDAKNRSIMTQTFLALMSEGKANDNDRILILNALFQPSNSQSDDGSPPHWFELMTERMKK